MTYSDILREYSHLLSELHAGNQFSKDEIWKRLQRLPGEWPAPDPHWQDRLSQLAAEVWPTMSPEEQAKHAAIGAIAERGRSSGCFLHPVHLPGCLWCEGLK